MRKNPSFASQALRLMAVASLACTVATVGCTTDRTPGAGAPQRYAPSVSPTMPSSVPGSEQSRPVNPPMISSYTPAPGVVVTRTRPNLADVADAAAAQGYRGRYLGPSDPTTGGYVMNPAIQTGQWQNPSLVANPQLTVNSSISSQPIPVTTAGGGGGFVAAAPVTAATPVTAASSVAASVAANPANASAPATVVTSNLGGFLTPTISSGFTASPNVASTPGVGNVGAGRTAVVTTAPAATRTTSALSTASGNATGGLVIGRSTNGTITITNVQAVGDRLVAKP
ncbi:MAG TPA: hypothetical protein VI670_20295 [Thermoanaerobaculia bacterium]|jgi:hypothetical protein